MYKIAVVIFAVIACAAAKPGLVAPLAYTAPAPFVTATSSQVIARNYNGIATAPVVASFAAKTIAAPLAAAYTTPVVAKTFASPVAAAYAAPFTGAAYSPFSYAAHTVPAFF